MTLVHGYGLQLIHDPRAHLHQPMAVPERLDTFELGAIGRCRRFERLEKSTSSVFSISLNIPTPPAPPPILSLVSS
jgi:hypothetical protein